MRHPKSAYGEPLEISRRQGKSPAQVPNFITSKHGIPKNQQGAGKTIAGYLQHGVVLLLTAILVVGIWVSPSVAALPTECIECHGTFTDVHGDVNHQATPGSGQVVLFADNDHDDAGWSGTPPYFEVTVDCVTCHNSYLPEIHSNKCATCHPAPYDTLATTACGQKAWNGGCQQGGCHSEFHENALTAHQPFAFPDETVNDCTRCHEASSWDVLQTNCLNCHAAPATDYVNTPVTTSNAQSSYEGTAEIDFSINENGKVGIGRTFYKLDGNEVASGSKVVISEPGSHDLEFWSVDQYGTTEIGTTLVSFNIVGDTSPPTTTSNARSSYYQGGIITLSATDDSTLGVQNTFYRLNDDPAQTGTTVILPTTPGIITYTLDFWSVDWSGNIETKNSSTFTVTCGTGTIRVVWWDCDTNSSHAPTSSDHVEWTIRRGGPTGYVVASGSGYGSSGWDGIEDIPVPVSPTPFYVYVYWEMADDAGDIVAPNTYVFTPGQVIRFGG